MWERTRCGAQIMRVSMAYVIVIVTEEKADPIIRLLAVYFCMDRYYKAKK